MNHDTDTRYKAENKIQESKKVHLDLIRGQFIFNSFN